MFLKDNRNDICKNAVKSESESESEGEGERAE
jgi:hypothetical protein